MAAVNKKLILLHRLKIAILLIIFMQKKARIRSKGKSIWVRKLFQERRAKGLYTILIKDLMLFDHEYFFKAFRMSTHKFEELLSWVAPFILKSSRIRDVTGPSQRLCITLWFLTTGNSQDSIATSFRVSPPTVGRIIPETCRVIWNELQSRGYLDVPDTEKKWKTIANEFEVQWNFPHCIGAIDGKHVVMQAPPRSGSEYFNYKKAHSIVLLAVCNARYEFTMLDIGDAGRQSDGGVYKNSELGRQIDNNIINRLEPCPINGSDKSYPYVFVADDAFQMKLFMLKPFARIDADVCKKIFNYRLSRARRIIENCFGIAAARFRIFRKPIIAKVETVVAITKAVVALHNYLMISQNKFGDIRYCPSGFTDAENSIGTIQAGEWRTETHVYEGLRPLGHSGSNNYSRTAKETRDDFMQYFNSTEGEVSWQWEYINRTIDPFDII